MDPQEATKLLVRYAKGDISRAPDGLASALISAGADVNAKDENGHSLLAVAVDRKNWRMFSALVSAGAKMSVEESTGLLLQYAKGELSGAPSDVVPVLVSRGANVNAKTDDGRSLLDLVSARKDWALFNDLVSAGAKMDIQEATDLLKQYAKGELSGAPSDVVPVLVSMGADVNAKDGDGHSLLFIADSHKNREAVRALTAAGAKMTPEEKQGFRYSLMSSYIRYGEWREIAEAVENKEIYLTDISSGSGQNAFHAVAQIGRDYDIDESFLVALKNAGVDINKKDAEGFSPLATAIKVFNSKAVAALLKYGANPSDSIPIQGAFGHAGEKKLMNYAIELHNESVGRLNEAIRQRNSMPISAGTPYPHSIRYRGPRGVENYNYDQRTLNESFERRIQEANSQISTRRQEVEAAKTIVSLMARATGTEVSDM